MTDYEKELLSLLKKSFADGECHYTFDVPDDPEKAQSLNSALQTLEDACHIMILHSPELTGDDFIEVEMYPPCCKPSPSN